jgi:tetratricopeptide (TPR) repeat protein
LSAKEDEELETFQSGIKGVSGMNRTDVPLLARHHLQIEVDGVQVSGEIVSLYPNDISIQMTNPKAEGTKGTHVPHFQMHRSQWLAMPEGDIMERITPRGLEVAHRLLRELYQDYRRAGQTDPDPSRLVDCKVTGMTDGEDIAVDRIPAVLDETDNSKGEVKEKGAKETMNALGDTRKPVELVRSTDASLDSVVQELSLYATSHPEDLAIRSALDSILDQLVDAAFELEDVAGDAALPIRLLEELATLFPTSPSPFVNLSKLCIDRDEPEAAIRYAEAGLVVAPDHTGLIFNKALSLLQIGKLKSGISFFKRYVQLNPDNPWAYNNIGDAYRELGHYHLAETFLKKAIEHDQSFIPAHFNLAMLYMDQEDWTHCVEYALIAERKGPADRDVQLALGDAYMGLGQPDLALKHLVTATLIDRGFVEAYETMSAAYTALSMYELSIAAANEALKLNPRSSMALTNIVRAHLKQGRFQDTLDPELQALEFSLDDEERSNLYWTLGWDYFLADQYTQALEYTEKAIQVGEDPDVALDFNKALILLAQGKANEANAACNQAIVRASVLGKNKDTLAAAKEAEDFIAKRGIAVEPGSAFFKLLNTKESQTATDAEPNKARKGRAAKVKVRRKDPLAAVDQSGPDALPEEGAKTLVIMRAAGKDGKSGLVKRRAKPSVLAQAQHEAPSQS